MTTAIDKSVEELLESVWTRRERADAGDAAASTANEGPLDPAAVDEARRRGWIETRGDEVGLTPGGERQAAGVIRRHRLAERLLFDVIGLDENTMELGACELEHGHILSEEATDRVCTFLGHPPVCPHNRKIPQGRCCEKFSQELRPLVTPLTQADVGGRYRIVFIASQAHHRLDRLAALGVVPAAIVQVHQRTPAVVVRIGGTDVALDPAVAREVFVVGC